MATVNGKKYIYIYKKVQNIISAHCKATTRNKTENIHSIAHPTVTFHDSRNFIKYSNLQGAWLRDMERLETSKSSGWKVN